jgi:hypothetical protein
VGPCCGEPMDTPCTHRYHPMTGLWSWSCLLRCQRIGCCWTEWSGSLLMTSRRRCY